MRKKTRVSNASLGYCAAQCHLTGKPSSRYYSNRILGLHYATRDKSNEKKKKQNVFPINNDCSLIILIRRATMEQAVEKDARAKRLRPTINLNLKTATCTFYVAT